VVAENPTAAEAALAVLEAGGNAADAAVTAALVAGVAQPVSSGLGGGGFALVWDASSRSVTTLDFREVAPAAMRRHDLARRPPSHRRRGVLVGVPGELAGLWAIHQRFGSRPFADLVRPAAKLADTGFVVSHHMSRALRWNRAWITATPGYASVFAPMGELLATPALARNPRLARTLERIAAEGRAAFYEGAIASEVVAVANRAGSRMTEQDLAAYRAEERTALHTRYEGYDVYTMPPPSGGGLLLAETLRMHSASALAKLGHGSGAYLHVLAETFRGAVADRARAIGDPGFVQHELDALLAPTRLERRRQRISLDRTRTAESFELREAGTSHIAVIDAEGNAVALTTTVNDMFGAKLLVAGGFVLNDELDDFSTQRLEERFGASLRPNSPRPGARPVSSMTPTVVTRDGRVVLVAGGSGGTRIATGVTQAVVAHLAFGRSADRAVADVRAHTPPSGGLLLEPEAPAALVADLRRRGELVRQRADYSAVGLITVGYSDGNRRIEAAGDRRKGGVGLVRRAMNR
jgi:gamma-glutamyltranspeptidase/glutathione hydrolase